MSCSRKTLSLVFCDRLALDYEPSNDDLRQLPPEGRKLRSIHLTSVTQTLVRKIDNNCQLIVPDALKRRLFDQAYAGPLAAHLGSESTLANFVTAIIGPVCLKMYKPGAARAT